MKILFLSFVFLFYSAMSFAQELPFESAPYSHATYGYLALYDFEGYQSATAAINGRDSVDPDSLIGTWWLRYKEIKTYHCGVTESTIKPEYKLNRAFVVQRGSRRRTIKISKNDRGEFFIETSRIVSMGLYAYDGPLNVDENNVMTYTFNVLAGFRGADGKTYIAAGYDISLGLKCPVFMVFDRL